MDKENKNPNVPNLRFDFKDDYTVYRLNEICKRVTRKNKNIESTLPLTISAQYVLVDQITFFNKSVASSNLEGYYLLKIANLILKLVPFHYIFPETHQKYQTPRMVQ